VILYGRNPVAEALGGRRAHTVQEIWAAAGALREPWLERARARGVRVHGASPAEIESRCGSAAHQGVCARAGPYPYASEGELLAADEALVVVLDQVQDPQNLGSICRTAECAGAAGVVIAERRAAAVTPAVCKASAGAVEHLAVAQVRNVADFLLQAREAGFWCYGASAGQRAGRTPPLPYDTPRLRRAGDRARAGRRGEGPSPACRGRVRSADLPAAAWAQRVVGGGRRRRGAPVRHLAAPGCGG
jgi:23S rRNA (guanosine2251-2'-O)-methyltransferase